MKKTKWMIVILAIALMCILPNAATQAQSEAKPQDSAKSSLLVRTIDKRSASGDINKTWNAEYRLVRRGDDSGSSSKTATSKMHQISPDKSDYGALFTDLEPGGYDVYQIVAPEGRLLVKNPVFVEVEGSGAPKILNFASPSATIRGEVYKNRYSAGGEPVQLVNLDDLKVYATGITDVDGQYNFENVAPGRYEFSSVNDVRDPNDKTVYITSRRQISVNKTTTNMNDEVMLSSGISFLDDALTIKVLDETTNLPLENVKVLFEGWSSEGYDSGYDHDEIPISGLTSNDGTVTFKNIGFQRVRISIEGADVSKTDADTVATLRDGIDINKPREVTLKATKKPKIVDTHSVRVNVIDTSDHKPILEPVELALVSASDPETIIQKSTSVNGVVTFSDVPKGDYVVKQLAVPVDAGYYRNDGEDLSISLTDDDTLDTVEFSVTVSSKSVTLKAAAVTRNETGEMENPVLMAVEYAVEYTSLSGLKQTNNYKSNEDGIYKLDKLKPGSYRVRVVKSDNGFIPHTNGAEQSFEIDSSLEYTDRTIYMALIRTRVVVTTQNEMEEALANAKYTVWKDGKQVEKGAEIVQIGNKTMIDFLAPGTYQLRQVGAVEGHEPLATPQEFEVLGGVKQLTEVTVINQKKRPVAPVSRNHTVRVNVVDDSDAPILEPVALGLVSASNPQTIIQKSVSANGVVTFSNVPNGEYIVKQLAVPVDAGYYLDESKNIPVSLTDDSDDDLEFNISIASNYNRGLYFAVVSKAGNNENDTLDHIVEEEVDFEVKYTSLSGEEETNHYQSYKNGYYYLSKLKVGNYRVRAIKSEGSFIPNSAEHSFAIDNSTAQKSGYIRIGLSRTRVEVTTKNEMQEALANAKYTIWKDGKQVEKGAEIIQIGNKTVIDFLAPGTYQLRQVGSVEGHEPLATPQTFEVLDGKKQLTEVTVINRKIKDNKPIKPEVEKTGSEGNATESKVEKAETTETVDSSTVVEVTPAETQTPDSLPKTGVSNHQMLIGALVTCLGLICLVLKKKKSFKN